jgi:hypothetical protein
MCESVLNNEIDFDEASRAWRKNKVSLGNGYFAYRCNYIHSNGKQCSTVVSAQKIKQKYLIRKDWITKNYEGSYEFCVKHRLRGPKQKNNTLFEFSN